MDYCIALSQPILLICDHFSNVRREIDIKYCNLSNSKEEWISLIHRIDIIEQNAIDYFRKNSKIINQKIKSLADNVKDYNDIDKLALPLVIGERTGSIVSNRVLVTSDSLQIEDITLVKYKDELLLILRFNKEQICYINNINKPFDSNDLVWYSPYMNKYSLTDGGSPIVHLDFEMIDQSISINFLEMLNYIIDKDIYSNIETIKLEDAVLDDSHIVKISTLPKLRKLILIDCTISRWQGLISNLNYLSIDNLRGIDVTELLSSITSAGHIKILNTNMTNIPSISHIANITRLTLNNVNLSGVVHIKNSSIETLSIEHNRITSFFLDMPELRSLDISNNKIPRLSYSMFARLPKLNVLIGTSNPDMTIDDNAFDNIDRMWMVKI